MCLLANGSDVSERRLPKVLRYISFNNKLLKDHDNKEKCKDEREKIEREREKGERMLDKSRKKELRTK